MQENNYHILYSSSDAIPVSFSNFLFCTSSTSTFRYTKDSTLSVRLNYIYRRYVIFPSTFFFPLFAFALFLRHDIFQQFISYIEFASLKRLTLLLL